MHNGTKDAASADIRLGRGRSKGFATWVGGWEPRLPPALSEGRYFQAQAAPPSDMNMAALAIAKAAHDRFSFLISLSLECPCCFVRSAAWSCGWLRPGVHHRFGAVGRDGFGDALEWQRPRAAASSTASIDAARYR